MSILQMLELKWREINSLPKRTPFIMHGALLTTTELGFLLANVKNVRSALWFLIGLPHTLHGFMIPERV